MVAVLGENVFAKHIKACGFEFPRDTNELKPSSITRHVNYKFNYDSLLLNLYVNFDRKGNISTNADKVPDCITKGTCKVISKAKILDKAKIFWTKKKESKGVNLALLYSEQFGRFVYRVRNKLAFNYWYGTPIIEGEMILFDAFDGCVVSPLDSHSCWGDRGPWGD